MLLWTPGAHLLGVKREHTGPMKPKFADCVRAEPAWSPAIEIVPPG